MPVRLRDRCQSDSIHEFRAAARERFDDGGRLETGDRRTGAIYLWGYTTEMTLKAAYFALLGFGDQQPITMADLRAAVGAAPQYGVVWPAQGNLHAVRGWGELLVNRRNATATTRYADPTFGLRVVQLARVVYDIWTETLRYHKNVAYAHEVRRVHEAAVWFLGNSLLL